MARASLGWSSRRLAEEAGVTPNTITNLEMERPVRFSTLTRIRRAFEQHNVRFEGSTGVYLSEVK